MSTNAQPKKATARAVVAARPCSTDETGWERELKVIINPRLGFWEYEGTRAQLEAEGVVPDGAEWPEGTAEFRWESGGFLWWLRRTRPAGLKGPMKLWARGDWWVVRCDAPIDYMGHAIEQKRRELAELLFWASPQGQMAGREQLRQYFAALDDEAFQVFKRSLPGWDRKARRVGGPSA